MLYLPLLTSAYICGNNATQDFAKGDPVPICVHFSPLSRKLLFLPRLDVYSAVEGKGAFNYFRSAVYDPVPDIADTNQTDTNQTDPVTSPLVNANTDVYLAVQVADSNLTTWIPYISAKLVAPVFSVVVDVDSGGIHSVEWDNSCSDCDTDCMERGGEEVCAQALCANLTSPDCDPKVYVSWIGKDKNGLNLESAGHRISAFRKFSLYDTYNNANKDF